MFREKILIIDDEPFIRDILRTTLEDTYEISEASDGEEGLQAIRTHNPALVIVDYKMPKKDGLEVCREIRQDPLYLHLPIIMLTGKGETQDKIRGLDTGVDDYIVKPFEPNELIARVRMVLKRSTRDLDANPLTRLPGNVTIISEITRYMEKKEKFATLYIDLDKFKAYNDHYGFQKGDGLIRETARIIIESVRDSGNSEDFIGHIGGDDFVVITSIEKAEKVAQKIIELFDSKIISFYSEEDRMQKFIIAKDRTGITQKFPFVSISIGIVDNSFKEFSHVGEISEIGAELKRYAKTFAGSVFVKNQRKSL